MKYLLITLFFILEVKAATLGQFKSSPEGSSVQNFNITAQKSTLAKHSNFFDSKKDLSLGEFKLKNTKNAVEDFKKINVILAKVQEVDKFMKAKDSSFNELSSKKNHESFLTLNDYRISQGSDLYQELKEIYDGLAAQEWQQVSGIKLSDDYKTLSVIKKGKVSSTEAFNFRFHCQKEIAPTVCGYKDLGILFIQ